MYKILDSNEKEEIEMYMSLPKETLVELLIQYQKTVESIPTKYIRLYNTTNIKNEKYGY